MLRYIHRFLPENLHEKENHIERTPFCVLSFTSAQSAQLRIDKGETARSANNSQEVDLLLGEVRVKVRSHKRRR